jgi:hypothetical protein
LWISLSRTAKLCTLPLERVQVDSHGVQVGSGGELSCRLRPLRPSRGHFCSSASMRACQKAHACYRSISALWLIERYRGMGSVPLGHSNSPHPPVPDMWDRHPGAGFRQRPATGGFCSLLLPGLGPQGLGWLAFYGDGLGGAGGFCVQDSRGRVIGGRDLALPQVADHAR